MKPWTRENTREWISQLEHRLDDIDHYLNKTVEWCEDYGVYDDRTVFMCSFLTCIWVSKMRDEPISYIELMEMLGVDEWEGEEEKIFDLDEKFAHLDHIELLECVVQMCNDEGE